MTGGLHKPGELRVGNVGLVHKEAVNVHAVNRTGVFGGLHPDFVHVRGIICAHGEFAPRNPNHALWSLSWRRIVIFQRRFKARYWSDKVFTDGPTQLPLQTKALAERAR